MNTRFNLNLNILKSLYEEIQTRTKKLLLVISLEKYNYLWNN